MTLTSGLVAYRSFDGNNGSDDSTNGRLVTGYNDLIYTGGKIGRAPLLNGSNQAFSGGDVLDMGTGDRTITAWFKTTETTDYAGIAGKSYYGGRS